MIRVYCGTNAQGRVEREEVGDLNVVLTYLPGGPTHLKSRE